MPSQVLNFLWLNLELPPPPDPADGSIRAPLPEKYIANIRSAGEKSPGAQIDLWIDSKRLTQKQRAYLQKSIEDGLPNVHLKDLRSIPAYDREPLYNEAEKDPEWGYDQTTIIWRQVDAAKILVSLQGNFDQTFFADLDHAHLDIDGPEAQGMLEKHGLFFGSATAYDCDLENQLWGFDRSRRGFFEEYYAEALRTAYDGDNAWSALLYKVQEELEENERIPEEEICLLINDDRTSAEHPGSELRAGNGRKSEPSLISARALAKIFNDNNPPGKKAAAVPARQKSAFKLKA